MLIPLAEIDAAKVLQGARVPLFCLRPDDDHRYEWIGDRVVALTPTGRPYLFSLADPRLDYTALDPTDADTARVLDHKIAIVRMAKGEHGRPAPTTPILGATLSVLRRQWTVLVANVTGGVYWWSLDGTVGAEIEPTVANIPTARAALVRESFKRTT